MKKHYRHHDTCLNCGYTVDRYFCSNCGQENTEPKESFWHFLSHGISHYFHFDSKFSKSVVPLLTRPGYLTNEYIAGRRASHLGPLGIYLFVSFIFFLFINIGKYESTTETVPGKKEKAATAPAKAQPDTITKISAGKTAEKTARPKDGYNYAVKNNSGNFVYADDDKSKSVEEYEKKQALKKPSERDNAFERFFKKKFLVIGQDNGKSFFAEVQHNIPKAMFILLPLFALILKLTYSRSKRYYIEHLIYSLHVHSFIFLYILIITLLSRLIDVKGISVALGISCFFVVVWYIYRSLRTVYKNSRLRTIVKMLVLSFVYLFLMLISIVAIGLITLINYGAHA